MKGFFEELKKRNVYRVATAYVVSSWLIMQVVNTMGTNLGWSNDIASWITKILIAGFPIALVLAWVYELTPQGLKKTGTTQAETSENKKVGRRLNQFIIGVLAIALCFLLVERIFFAESKIDFGNSEASIAVLPFKNDSPDEKNVYFCDGITEGVRENLSRVPSLSVISRTSVEQFRENPSSVAEIAKKLGVQYILEGSVLRLEDRSIIRARLIYAPDERNMWSEEFDRELEDIFSVLAEVTAKIAQKLERTIAPEVMKNIEYEPTDDLIAYDYYLQGKEYLNNYELGGHKENLEKADLLFKLSLDRDCTFAQAHVERALVFREQHQFEFFNNENLVDSVLFLCNKAISLDPNSSDAYYLRGSFYDDFLYDLPKAKEDLNRALELNPNHTRAIGQLAWLNWVHNREIVTALRLFKKLEKLDRSESGLLGTYIALAELYWDLWEHEEAFHYLEKAIAINPGLNGLKAWFFIQQGKIEEAIELVVDAGDSRRNSGTLGFFYLLLEDYDEALRYFETWEKIAKLDGIEGVDELRDWHRYGQVLVALDREEEGIKFMEYQLELNKKLLLNFQQAHSVHYEDAGIYAFLGDEKQAFTYLRKFDSINRWDAGKLHFILTDPLFDNIREKEEFKAIINKRMEEIKKVREEVRSLEASGKL
jgi:TolB-like protein